MQRSVVLFPGQGAQYVGMGKDNVERHAAARDIFERAGAIVDLDLATLCFEGPKEELDRTDVSQPAIFVSSAASLAAHEELGRDLGDPIATAGLSLGEYTALYYAGVLSFESALSLVAVRGRLMQEACELEMSSMASVLGLDRAAVEAVCDDARGAETLVVANVNSADQIVISGHLAALKRAEAIAEERGARKVVALSVAGAFHSPIMEPAREALAAEIERTEMAAPRIPIVSNVSATRLETVEDIRRALVLQLTSPVLWYETMTSLQGDGPEAWYEVGPGRVLAGLARRIDRSIQVVGVDRVGTDS